ncbi:spermatogenesis associated 6-like protein [Balearica regulorum gibbericeps]|uniref:spermatogenesis associated 6-like protein n=1 Tax=Balearica regulorum gibbericeps TaxID=100784 RepID=UPI003F645032
MIYILLKKHHAPAGACAGAGARPGLPGVAVKGAAGRAATENAATRGGGAGPRAATVGGATVAVATLAGSGRAVVQPSAAAARAGPPAQVPLPVVVELQVDAVFESAVDPAAVAEMLESHVMKFELTQLMSSVGDDLAVYEEITQNCLFPKCKLTPISWCG